MPPHVCTGSAAVEEAEVAEGVWVVERVVLNSSSSAAYPNWRKRSARYFCVPPSGGGSMSGFMKCSENSSAMKVVSGGECVVVFVSETVTTQLFGVSGRLSYD